jgi:hypothetical protein
MLVEISKKWRWNNMAIIYLAAAVVGLLFAAMACLAPTSDE